MMVIKKEIYLKKYLKRFTVAMFDILYPRLSILAEKFLIREDKDEHNIFRKWRNG